MVACKLGLRLFQAMEANKEAWTPMTLDGYLATLRGHPGRQDVQGLPEPKDRAIA